MQFLHKLRAEITTKVRYAETDQMGVVYHANYFIWFNIAMDRLLEKIGISIIENEKQGYMMPIVEASCKYLFPARYGDDLIIRVTPEKSSVARIIAHYEVIKSTNKRLLAKGRTVSVLMNGKGKLIIRFPEKYKEIMKKLNMD